MLRWEQTAQEEEMTRAKALKNEALESLRNASATGRQRVERREGGRGGEVRAQNTNVLVCIPREQLEAINDFTRGGGMVRSAFENSREDRSVPC